MLARFQSPLLLALIALAFAFGHGHQVIERFHAHEHGTAPECQDKVGEPCVALSAAQAGEHDSKHGEPATGHGHCCTHHSAAAVLHTPRLVLGAWMNGCDWLRSADALLPDAPVIGIEHPPQIARG